MIRVLDGEDAYCICSMTCSRPRGNRAARCCSSARTTARRDRARRKPRSASRGNGVRFRCLIEAGNNFARWPRKEYRQIPKEYFNHDLQVIYADKVAQMIDGGEKS